MPSKKSPSKPQHKKKTVRNTSPERRAHRARSLAVDLRKAGWKALDYLTNTIAKATTGGEIDAQGVRAAIAILNKVAPDLKAVEVAGEIEHKAEHTVEFR